MSLLTKNDRVATPTASQHPVRTLVLAFHKQPRQLRFLDSLITKDIRFQTGLSFKLFFTLDQLLGFKPMLKSSSLWAPVSKVKAIREGFDHLMLGRFHMRYLLDPGDAFDVQAGTVTIG